MDLEDLKFFRNGKYITEVFDEFGEVYGANLMKEFLEDGFIETNPNEENHFYLTGAGKKKIGKVQDDAKKILEVFLSYSLKDYDNAKQLKEFLEEFGMNVFLAHTSIEPSRAWEEEIIKNLKGCDIFIPMMTNNFEDSKWTDQECGIAYNEGKKIIPLMVDLTPYGFLGKFQALRVDTSKWIWKDKDDRVKLIDFINQEFPQVIRESVLNSMEKTRSWIIGKTKIKILKSNEPFSKEEINKIIEASTYNSQIYDAEGARSYLVEIINKYGGDINSESKTLLLNRIEQEKAREVIGGKSEWGGPILYGTAEEKLKQLEGYGGELIEEMRENLKKEIEAENKTSLVDGLKKHL